MTVALSINGVTYDYPETGDLSWGPDATEWAQAVTSGMLQKAGGLFQLLSDVDFGTSYGVKSLYYKSRTANVASAGQIRLAQADVISFRNNANSGDLNLGVSADALTFNGAAIGNFVSVSDTGRIDLTLSAGNLSADIVSGSITNTYINASAAIAYSKLNLSGSIVNADVSASAAIVYSKLSLTNSIVNADISSSAAIAFSKLATLTGGNVILGNSSNIATSTSITGDIGITDAGVVSISAGVIVNADVSASAAIAFSKLASLTSANIIVGSVGNVATAVAVTGDIGITDAGVVSITAGSIVNADVNASAAIAYSKLALSNSIVNADINSSAAIANSKLATMADITFKGNISGGVTTPSDLTAAQVTANLNVMGGASGTGLKGLVPSQVAGDATKFLNGNGAWSTPAGAGDVTGPGSATDNAVARFDSTTGKLLQNSVVTISDTGATTGITDLTVTGATTLATTLTGVVKAVSGVINAATILNSDVSAVAAIDYSKLATLSSGNIVLGSAGNVATSTAVTGDITISNTGVTAIGSGVIVNADISGSAAIDYSKLATLTSGNILVGSAGNVPTSVAMSGDATIIASGALTVANSAVIGKLLTGYTSGAGTVAATDTILQGIQKLNGNAALTVASNRIQNLGIAATVAASALTVAIKTASGSDATSTTAISVGFRNSTLATGQFSTVNITGALSLVISSGSTLGQSSALGSYVYVYLINNGGTAELAVSRTIQDEGLLVTTVAEGGAGGADSASTVYSTTARSNVPIRLIGRFFNTQATAGTWATNPSEIAVTPFIPQKVSAYYTTTAQTFSNITNTRIQFDTKQYDSNNAVTTGASWVFTAPRSARYTVCVGITFSGSTAWGPGEQCYIQLRVSGDDFVRYLHPSEVAGTLVRASLFVSASWYMDKGTTCYAVAYQDTGGNLSLEGSANNNFITIIEEGL